jgi:hypothetical protein
LIKTRKKAAPAERNSSQPGFANPAPHLGDSAILQGLPPNGNSFDPYRSILFNGFFDGPGSRRNCMDTKLTRIFNHL